MDFIIAAILLLNAAIVLFGARSIVLQLKSNQNVLLGVENTFATYAHRFEESTHNLTMILDEISINTARLSEVASDHKEDKKDFFME